MTGDQWLVGDITFIFFMALVCYYLTNILEELRELNKRGKGGD